MLKQLKKMLRSMAPQALIRARYRWKSEREDQRFAGRSPAEIFGTIYRDKLWGASDGDEYCSGTGSHDDAVVRPYVESLRSFLEAFPTPPDVVDLGCGDFNVGSRIRSACGHYVAVDVVPELIARNARVHGDLGVEFKCVDLVADPLPAGQVAFLRQVLQHLGNEQIGQILPKLRAYEWLVLTEHLPEDPAFVPNHDKPAGPGVRSRYGSAVVLTAPPFNLVAFEERELCIVREGADAIRTVAYRLAGPSA